MKSYPLRVPFRQKKKHKNKIIIINQFSILFDMIKLIRVSKCSPQAVSILYMAGIVAYPRIENIVHWIPSKE